MNDETARKVSDAAPWTQWSRERLMHEIERLRIQHGVSTLDTADLSEGYLHTVRVPPPFADRFVDAERFVADYFSQFRRDPSRATIDIGGERYLLLRAASMSVEFVDLVTSLYRDRGNAEARAVANNLLFDFGHALGRADARAFHERTGVKDPIARLSTGPVHFAFSGWASVHILEDSAPAPDETFFLHYDHPYSFESHSWMTKGRNSEAPVCVMNAGYSSGWCEDSFGLSLVATEVECLAAGDERCRFVMAPPSQIETHLQRLGYHTNGGNHRAERQVAVPEFFQRRRWEDELRLANLLLEEKVAERTQALTRANDELRLLAKAVENALEGVVMLQADERGRLIIRSVNRGFEVVTGITGQEALGNRLTIIELLDPRSSVLSGLREKVRNRQPVELEVNARRPDGAEYTLEIHAMPADAGDAGSRDWIGLFRDVTRRQRHLSELRRQATIDALTSLPNRAMLFERLEAEIENAIASGSKLALFVIDLDGFKSINDNFGHHVGDSLLEQIGPRLKRGVRARDLVARLGGDEFAMLLPEVGDRNNAQQRARDILAALKEPFDIAGQPVALGASIGIAMCPADSADASALLRRADVAMYVAKEHKRGPELYREDIDRRSPERITLLSEVMSAIEGGQMVVHYQPQVDLISGQTERVEALVRWQHPEQGLLLPEKFIPLIELGDQIEALTEWVLHQALIDCAQWRRAGFDADVAINVPPRLLRHEEFVESVLAQLQQQDVAAKHLTLEVTESGILADIEQALPVFESLRRPGIRMSFDDFGTGYSSFTHLRRLPMDEIKIDRTFVSQMVCNDQDGAIVRSTIDLARSIGRTVVAEGVEDEATLTLLEELGCNLAQGFHLGRPMPFNELMSWLRER